MSRPHYSGVRQDPQDDHEVHVPMPDPHDMEHHFYDPPMSPQRAAAGGPGFHHGGNGYRPPTVEVEQETYPKFEQTASWRSSPTSYDPQPQFNRTATHLSAAADSNDNHPAFDRTDSYRSAPSGEVPLRGYPRQDYVMPLWPEDDIYRLGTPVAGADAHGWQPPPPPPPPKSYDIDENDMGDYGFARKRQQGHGSYESRQPILHSYSSRSTVATDSSETTLASPPPPGARKANWGDIDNVQLNKGNLVLNCPLPTDLINAVPKKVHEFGCMRYSAVTCDPLEFTEKRFALRQQLFQQRRRTELFIVITMYAEDEILFAKTMIGVFRNIEYMCKKAKEAIWREDGWKKIVVCVVSDGRKKIHPKTRSLLAAMGCFQEGIAKFSVNDQPVQAHLYEHTTQVGLQLEGGKVKAVPNGLQVPVQMLFCLKENNGQKINSHRWFFEAFGPALEPHICVLIDAGTKPGKDSIYRLWEAFQLNEQCAGACGEIKAELTGWDVWKNPLVATQNFEYKMSNILDKPLESAFGFISVLPGAFSAYRYSALQNDCMGNGPLQMYFKGEAMHKGTLEASIWQKNMYLAEDRILCFELVTKKGSNWTLQYVKSAQAETDVPGTVVELVKQRRRWLNGSFFAAIFALAHTKDIWRSNHSLARKIVFLAEFFYQTISLLFSWFALANFFLVFRILAASLAEPEMRFRPGAILSVFFEWLYFGTLFTCFILGLGNKPEGSKKVYFGMMCIWSVVMSYLIFAAVFITVRSINAELADGDGISAGEIFANQIFRDLIVSLSSTYVLYFLASFMYFEPWHMFTSFFQYLLLSPSYINVLNVYAFCNVHDISWGTKGLDSSQGHVAKKDQFVAGKAGDGSSVKQNAVDRDTNYAKELQTLAGLLEKPPPPKTEPELAQERALQESYDHAQIRCWVVLAWCSTNFALAATIMNSGGLSRLVSSDREEVQNTRSTIYMAVVLWSVAFLSLIRFLGATWFLVLRLFRGV